MRMYDRCMHMRVRMRFVSVPGFVRVLVVFVVNVRVGVLLHCVRVPMFMTLCQVQPDAGSHQ
jgi:hypothetical protein